MVGKFQGVNLLQAKVLRTLGSKRNRGCSGAGVDESDDEALDYELNGEENGNNK